jgi:predicted unusual protein kinase regulating ubiquinone biosynthesis (AarF/ABC1/UbiB family)
LQLSHQRNDRARLRLKILGQHGAAVVKAGQHASIRHHRPRDRFCAEMTPNVVVAVA